MIHVGMGVSSLAVALDRRSIRSFAGRAVFRGHMGRLTRSAIVATCVLAGAPATAAAATWTAPLARCYVSVGPLPPQRQVVTLGATGFTPLGPVDVLIDGAPADATDDGQPDPWFADPEGRVSGAMRAPYQPSGERAFGISVTERANPANTVMVTGRVTALDVTLTPAEARPSRRVRFSGRGFIKAAPVWGHYLFRGKPRKTVQLSRRPKDACGTFSVKQRQIPIFRPHTGRWVLQVDQQKAYSATPASVSARVKITVERRPKAR
jgi:hypothetical protein